MTRDFPARRCAATMLLISAIGFWNSAAADPVWTPVPQQGAIEFRPVEEPRLAAPVQFVPVEQMDKAFPRKLSDDIDAVTVLEIIALILAADRIVDGRPTTTKPQKPATGEPHQ